MTPPSSHMNDESLEFLRQVLRELTHEIAAPLTPLFGHLDLLELRAESALSPMQERCVAAMRRSLRRLSAINDRMLELARLERGHIPCQPVPITPQAVISEVRRRCQKQAAEKGIELLTNSAPVEDIRIIADWNLLVIAVGHLVDNALRCSDPGGQVILRVELSEKECALVVEDRGPAVPESELDRLAHPFFRVTDTESYTETAGLGLTIVELIARRLDARLALSLVAPEDEEHPGLRARLVLSRVE